MKDKIRNLGGIFNYIGNQVGKLYKMASIRINQTLGLILNNCTGDNIIDYSIYGECKQVQTEQSANLADADVLYKQMEEFNKNDLEEMVIDNKSCIKFMNIRYSNGGGFKGLSNIKFKENTAYTIRGMFRIFDTSIVSGSGLYLYAFYTDGTSIVVSYSANGENWIEFRIVTSKAKTISHIAFSYGSLGIWLLDKDSLCVSEGDVTEYMPFVPDRPSIDYPSEIKSVGDLVTEGEHAGKYRVPIRIRGKNFFNINEENVKNINIDNIYINDNSITLTSSNLVTTSYLMINIDYPVNKPLTISFDATILEGYDLGVAPRIYFRGDKVYGQIFLENNQNKKSYKVTINDGIPEKNILFWLYIKCIQKAGTIKIKFDNLQIEEGDTATAYEPYHEPILSNIYLDGPLRKVDKYVDYINFEEQKVYRNNRKVEITNKGSITITNKYDDCFAFRLFNASDISIFSLCNMFKFIKSHDNIECFYVTGSTSNLLIVIKKDRINYVDGDTDSQIIEKFREWLNNNYIYIVDKLSNTTTEDIVLPALPTFEGTTIIEIDTEIKPSNLWVKYYSSK